MGLLLATTAACTTAPVATPSGSSSTSRPATTTAAGGATSAGRVTRLVDGDTLWVSGVKVRLIGVDTPETRRPGTPVQCFGEASSLRMAALLPVGTPVRLGYDRARLDRYGRTLAYVYRVSDGLFVNAELVLEGYAKVLTVPPDTAHQRDFEALQRSAQHDGRGRWSACPLRS